MSVEYVNVVVADNYLDNFSKVVERCKQAGLQVEQELKAVGVISGSIDSAKREDLSQVEGVAAVEQSRGIQIAPPDSDIQ